MKLSPCTKRSRSSLPSATTAAADSNENIPVAETNQKTRLEDAKKKTANRAGEGNGNAVERAMTANDENIKLEATQQAVLQVMTSLPNTQNALVSDE